MFDMTDCFDAPEMLAIAASIAPQNNHDATIVIAWTPQPIALMIADRFRQSEPGTEEIDRTGFAIVVRENRGRGLFVGRKRIVNARGFFGHLAPAKFIGEILR